MKTRCRAETNEFAASSDFFPDASWLPPAWFSPLKKRCFVPPQIFKFPLSSRVSDAPDEVTKVLGEDPRPRKRSSPGCYRARVFAEASGRKISSLVVARQGKKDRRTKSRVVLYKPAQSPVLPAGWLGQRRELIVIYRV